MREKREPVPRPARKGGTDFKRLARLSDEEIERMAASDTDNPATSKDDWANAFIGLPPLTVPVNAKFDSDVVDWFKSQGRGYQARMNAVLRRYMEVHRKGFGATETGAQRTGRPKMSTNPEAIIRVADPASGLRAMIVIDSTVLGPALGGVRMLPYPSQEAAEFDVRRLAHGMTLKNAIAGLPFGGGKAVIIGDPQTDKTEALLEAFGRAVDKQGGGIYFTSADMNIHTPDLRIVARKTRFIAGFDHEGETGRNPSPYTALGVFEGIKAAAKYRWGRESLEGRTVAIQGLGEVGVALAERLHNAGARLIVADTIGEKVSEAVGRFAAITASVDEILAAECDILAPCARGAILNRNTIPSIKATIVAGCASNQLLEDDDGWRLLKRGILYAPDYVINAGGVIRVAGEITGWPLAEIERRTLDIRETLLRIFGKAEAERCPTGMAAEQLAQEPINTASAYDAAA